MKLGCECVVRLRKLLVYSLELAGVECDANDVCGEWGDYGHGDGCFPWWAKFLP